MTEPVRYVVDASVAIKIFIEQTDSDKAKALFNKLEEHSDTELHVPELFYVECANVLQQYVRRVGYPAAKAKANLARLQKLALQRASIVDVVNEALDIAIAQNISAYDACYVQLSQKLQLPLITADLKLIRSLAETTYEVDSLSSL